MQNLYTHAQTDLNTVHNWYQTNVIILTVNMCIIAAVGHVMTKQVIVDAS